MLNSLGQAEILCYNTPTKSPCLKDGLMTIESTPQVMPDFDDLADRLRDQEVLLSPAEIHGQLCGYICAGEHMNGVAWLDPQHLQSQPALFMQLYQVSFQKINDFAFDFELLLPDEDTDLQLRAQALGDWCAGFLIGIGMSGMDIEGEDAEETVDALMHIEAIADIDYENLSMDNTDERAFLEVIEYVRLAVLMLHANIAGIEESKFDMMPAEDDIIH